MKRKKIIIANSTGRLENGRKVIHFPSRWTYSVTDRWKFNYYPYQLAYLSSMLKRDTDHDVKMMDACLEDWTADRYIEEISREEPDYIVFDTATLVYGQDLKVAKALKKRFGTKSIFAGQHPTAFPKEVLNDGADMVCIGEFEETLVEFFQGKDPSTLLGVYPNGYRKPLDVNTLPFPEDDDVSRIRYSVPHKECQEYVEIEAFGSRGCPYTCNFCVCGNITYSKPNWRCRNVENVVEEIKIMKAKYPQMEGFFFDEEMHNANKRWLQSLCRAMIENGLHNMKHEAMSGFWGFDYETLALMREAGYYKIRVGVESTEPEALKSMNKPLDVKKVHQVLKWCKEVGMRVYGTFTLGAWGSTKEMDMSTLHALRNFLDQDLLWDFQVSINTPQPGTPFYKLVKDAGYLISDNPEDFDGDQKVIVNYPNYRKEDIEGMSVVASKLAEQTYATRRIRDHGALKVFVESLRRRGATQTALAGFRFLKRKISPPL